MEFAKIYNDIQTTAINLAKAIVNTTVSKYLQALTDCFK